MIDLPIWRRIQCEFGFSFRGLPWKNLTWAKWAFDPFALLVWPGRRIAYKDSPEGCWSEPWTRPDTYVSESMSAEAAYYWASAAIRILGFDLGVGILYRPKAVLAA